MISSNSNMPAMPISPASPNSSDPEWAAAVGVGLTKREHFCLEMGVAETGDTELDEIINKGNRIKLAGLAMQGVLASDVDNVITVSRAVLVAIEAADALLTELDKVQQ